MFILVENIVMKTSIFDEQALDVFLKENKIQSFRKKQIYQEIFDNQNINFLDMISLSVDLRAQFVEHFVLLNLHCETSLEDQQTTKFAFKTHDWQIVEAVLMYHWSKLNEKKLNRITLCISSQVGCPVGCAFCITGKLWVTRNLTTEEMLSQILYANSYIKKRFAKKEDGSSWKLRNIVFMGMWEPLLNYANMKKLFPYLLDQQKLSLSRRHITISTVGIIPGIQKLIDDKIKVKLAVSLHAPNQALREDLIPYAKMYPLDKLLNVLDRYIEATDNRIFYEYIMIKDTTDTLELAHELWKLLTGKLVHLNLIPYNENPVMDFEETSRNQIFRFKKVVEDYGVTVTIRDSMWRDVNSACGQLGHDKLVGK